MGSVDDSAKGCIRREALSFYERNELPTVDNLLIRVRRPPVSVIGAYSSLLKLLKQLNFKFKKIESGRRILMERNNNVVKKIST